ncbi:DUF21 domain-containing protein [symbiont of Argiope bruennichi]|uniref:CNNM domain-containing protein n=1 Tax=symbiont of Argiope bruennichi TaxID=2810479 RepID=UPI003DA6259C
MASTILPFFFSFHSELIFWGIILLVSFIFIYFAWFTAASESALSNSTIVRLHNMLLKKNFSNKKIKQVIKLFNNYNKLLSTLILFHNLIEILLPAIITFILMIAKVDHDLVILVIVVNTLLLLFVGEVFPKIFVKKKPELFFINNFKKINFFYRLGYGFNFLLFSVFKIKEPVAAPYDERELLRLLDYIESGGFIEKKEKKFIQNAIIFDDITIKDSYISWDNVLTINEDEPVKNVFLYFEKINFSRIPVVKKETNFPIAWIEDKDFFLAYIKEQNNLILKNHFSKKSLLFVYQNEIKQNVFNKLIQKNVSFAIVLSETNGNILGIISIEDLIEDMFGDINYDRTIDNFIISDNLFMNFLVHKYTPIKILESHLYLKVFNETIESISKTIEDKSKFLFFYDLIKLLEKDSEKIINSENTKTISFEKFTIYLCPIHINSIFYYEVKVKSNRWDNEK